MGGPDHVPRRAPATRCVFGDLSYRLPDVWIGGVTWRLRPGLELSAMARWLWLHVHDRIDVRLTGPTLEAAGVPQHIVLYRGFHDVWDLRGRVSYWFRERVRLGAQLRVETSAVDASAVNAAAVDGLTVEPMALVEGRLSRHLWLGGRLRCHVHERRRRQPLGVQSARSAAAAARSWAATSTRAPRATPGTRPPYGRWHLHAARAGFRRSR